jgi:hypothetical protein
VSRKPPRCRESLWLLHNGRNRAPGPGRETAQIGRFLDQPPMNCAQRRRLTAGGCVLVTTRAVFATVSLAGLFQCAREDSNLHGPYGPQGPQPCASTNSATGAGGGEYSPGRVPEEASDARRSAGKGRLPARRFVSVLEPRYIPEHMFVSVQIAEPNEQGGDPWT